MRNGKKTGRSCAIFPSHASCCSANSANWLVIAAGPVARSFLSRPRTRRRPNYSEIALTNSSSPNGHSRRRNASATRTVHGPARPGFAPVHPIVLSSAPLHVNESAHVQSSEMCAHPRVAPLKRGGGRPLPRQRRWTGSNRQNYCNPQRSRPRKNTAGRDRRRYSCDGLPHINPHFRRWLCTPGRRNPSTLV